MAGTVRQGDILLVPVDGAAPDGARATSEVILALGERTGHAHRLTGAEVYEWEADGQRYVRVHGGIGSISHEDHDPTPAAVIEADVTYRVIRQRERNLAGEWRTVQD